MAANGTESIPTTWNDERDTAFFRITAQIFSCEFIYGAGVLLASYDDEPDTTVPATTTTPTTSTGIAQLPAGHVTAR
jgi:hypothetical protein